MRMPSDTGWQMQSMIVVNILKMLSASDNVVPACYDGGEEPGINGEAFEQRMGTPESAQSAP